MRKGYCLFLCLLLFAVRVQASEEAGIQGSNTVEIAVQGESIAQYHAPEDYKLQLKESVPGVQMDTSGKLIVSKDTQEQTIVLVAYKGESTLVYEVELVHSWTKQVAGAELYQIPNPEDTRKINNMEEIEQYLPIQGVGIVLLSSAALIWLRYHHIRRKMRR